MRKRPRSLIGYSLVMSDEWGITASGHTQECHVCFGEGNLIFLNKSLYNSLRDDFKRLLIYHSPESLYILTDKRKDTEKFTILVYELQEHSLLDTCKSYACCYRVELSTLNHVQ